MIKDIIWEDHNNGNIQTKYGRVDGMVVFDMARFHNQVFNNENWVMTSHVIPMEMVKDVNSEELKAKAILILEEFVNKLTK
jgi:hypothetical protein